MQRNNENSLKITANILGGLDYFVSKQASIVLLNQEPSVPVSVRNH